MQRSKTFESQALDVRKIIFDQFEGLEVSQSNEEIARQSIQPILVHLQSLQQRQIVQTFLVQSAQLVTIQRPGRKRWNSDHGGSILTKIEHTRISSRLIDV